MRLLLLIHFVDLKRGSVFIENRCDGYISDSKQGGREVSLFQTFSSL